ncbi:MAG: amidohydrolase family protein [Nakamurella sp.]
MSHFLSYWMTRPVGGWEDGRMADGDPRIIDTHVHVWDLDGESPIKVTYPWLGEHLPVLNRSHRLAEFAADPAAQDIDAIVLVQSSDQLAETDELLRVAAGSPWPTRVTGWLPLADPEATRQALSDRPDATALVAVRHLIHDEPDAQWLLRSDVADGLTELAAAGLVFEAVAERPDLLAQVPVVARRHPDLVLVLDHLGKPPLSGSAVALDRWREQLREAAAPPNVTAKISGLGTVSPTGWTADTWRPVIDHALDCFGADRLMLGGDWPVALQAGTQEFTWASTLHSVEHLPETDRAAVLGSTAARVYRF